MAELNDSFRPRQAVLNTVSTGIAFGLSILIGIWFTPFLVGRIGADSFGLVMLATTVVGYAGPLAQSVSTTTLRELALARASGEPGAMQRSVNNGMRLCLRIVAVLAMIVIPLALLGPALLGISRPFRPEASAILLLTGAGFMVWMLSAPFAAILYLANRIDIGNYSQALQNVIRVAGAVALLGLVSSSPLWVPAAALAAIVLSLLLVVGAARSISSLDMRFWRDKGAVPLRLGGMGTGVFGQSAAVVLLCGTELVVVNYMTDEVRAGMYAAAIQIPVLARGAMFALGNQFGPQIMALHTEGDRDGAHRATAQAVTLLGLVAALPVGVALAAAPQILRIWLGEEFTPYAVVLQLEMVTMLVFTAIFPLYILTMAAGRTIVPALIRISAALVYVALGVVLFRTTGLGLASVAAALAIGIVTTELGLMAPHTARTIGAPWHTFLKPFIPVVAALAIAYALSLLALSLWTPSSVIGLGLFGAGVGAVYASVCLALVGRRELAPVVATLRAVTGSRATIR